MAAAEFRNVVQDIYGRHAADRASFNTMTDKSGKIPNLLFIDMSRYLHEGPARSAIQLLRHIDRIRIKPMPVFCLNAAERSATERMVAATVHTIPMRRLTYRLGGFEIVRFLLQARVSVNELCRFIKHEGVDIVHINTINNIYAALAARRCGVPYLLFVREMLPSRMINDLYVRWICRRAAAVVAVSDSVRQRLLKAGVEDKKITVIYNGVELPPDGIADKADELRREFNIPENVPVIGMVGTIGPLKGQMVAVQAVAALVKSFPDLRLIVVGDPFQEPGFKGYLDSVRRFVEEHGIEKNVIILGVREDVPVLMAMFDVLVQPSVGYDSMPRTVIEAMAAGKPVVGSSIGGIPEMITHGKTGFIVEPGSHEALARAVATILSSVEIKKKMGAAAVADVMDRFNSEKQAGKLLDLYERVLAGI
ncbi:MAG: glycosyltransferase family 4 protein [bacterium]